MNLVKNAGEFDTRIEIVREVVTKDSEGFPTSEPTTIYTPYASVKTTKGFTLIANGSDFEKATTNFTIRYPDPLKVVITRKDKIHYKGKVYEILYLNNIDEADVLLEIQAKEVTH